MCQHHTYVHVFIQCYKRSGHFLRTLNFGIVVRQTGSQGWLAMSGHAGLQGWLAMSAHVGLQGWLAISAHVGLQGWLAMSAHAGL